MKNIVKRVVNGVLMPLGYEVCKVGQDPFFAQSSWLGGEAATILDVGAAGGEMIERYRKMFPGATIHAFEPDPNSFRLLQGLFGEDGRVELNRVAVADAPGQVEMNVNALAATNSLLPADPRGDEIWGEGPLKARETIQVPAITLDDYCRSQGIESVDIIKLDIQGSELNALRGARSLLEGGQVKLIYTEIILAPTYIGQPNFEDYLGFFRGVGYLMLNLYNLVKSGMRLIQIDAIFVRDTDLAAR